MMDRSAHRAFLHPLHRYPEMKSTEYNSRTVKQEIYAETDASLVGWVDKQSRIEKGANTGKVEDRVR